MSEGKQGIPVWVWVAIAVPLLFVMLAIGAPIAFFGVRKYITNAKQAEANAALVTWGDGLVRCAAREGGLPASSAPVPLSLSSLSGHKYQSTAAEWSAPAHTCAGFSMRDPQYYQYSWSLRTQSEGLLQATADLDGDGTPDSEVQLPVTCVGGNCSHGAPLAVGKWGSSSAGSTSPTGLTPPRASDDPPRLYMVLSGLAVLAMLGCGIWLIVTAFQVSVGWGLITWFVPCGAIIFAVQHWDRAKKPFLSYLAAFGSIFVLGMGFGAYSALTDKSVPTAPPAAAPGPTEAPGVVAPPPLPSAGPLPAFDGSLVDVSSVMGRARKLANAWDPDAALLSVEATVQSGKIQPQLGGSARLTFGPSPFAASATRTGLFVVTYDQSGIHGAPQPGKPGAALPEPMCSPEAALLRVAELGTAPISLRYGLDSVQRPSWILSPVSDPKNVHIFEPQACAPRGTIVVRPGR